MFVLTHLHKLFSACYGFPFIFIEQKKTCFFATILHMHFSFTHSTEIRL